MDKRVDEFLRKMIAVGASDLHLTTHHKPYLRVHGEIEPVEEWPVLTPELNRQVLYELMSEDNRQIFERDWDADFAYELGEEARFRVNVFMDRFGIGGVLRQIPTRVPTAEQLGLPKVVVDFCGLKKGLVLVTGPTGSGKSTTLAAMLDYVNRSRQDHIITIEDPIEFVHRPARCLINQREVHRHTRSFANALRAALREDPDIVLVGEMRDLETMEIAIETAETGHLVFGTLHTNTAASTVDRIIDKFPADRQNQIRTMLADSLKGVVAQTLCRRKGGGRVAALEILVVTPAIAANIREGKTHQIPSAIQVGKSLGMQMLNDHLMRLVVEGVILPREAYLRAVERDDIEKRLRDTGLPLDIDTVKLTPAAEGAISVDRLRQLKELADRCRQAMVQNGQDVQALNNLAWILATSMEPSLRNGREAVKLAERANTLGGGQDYHVLDTLAAAYAEVGQFPKALEVARRRLAMAGERGDAEGVEAVKAQVRLFESGMALRDVH